MKVMPEETYSGHVKSLYPVASCDPQNSRMTSSRAVAFFCQMLLAGCRRYPNVNGLTIRISTNVSPPALAVMSLIRIITPPEAGVSTQATGVTGELRRKLQRCLPATPGSRMCADTHQISRLLRTHDSKTGCRQRVLPALAEYRSAP